MPKGYPSLFPEQKREITARIKEKGERVADLAKEYYSPANSLLQQPENSYCLEVPASSLC